MYIPSGMKMAKANEAHDFIEQFSFGEVKIVASQ